MQINVDNVVMWLQKTLNPNVKKKDVLEFLDHKMLSGSIADINVHEKIESILKEEWLE
jgi:hypothetical protein